MASKTKSSLSNDIVSCIQEYIPLGEDEEEHEEQLAAYQAIADSIIKLVDQARAAEAPAVAAPKKFVFKPKAVAGAAAPATESGMTKKGKLLSNYQRFVQVMAAAWKVKPGAETELGKRLVTPIQTRPPGASKSKGTLDTLVSKAEITWGEEQTFQALLDTVRAQANERMGATGVMWLMLDDDSRAIVCA